MFGLPAGVRILLASEPADMRRGVDGLSALVRRQFEEPLFSGTLFVFLSTRCDRIKVLWWSAGGFVVLYKRLERGRFRRPEPRPDGRVHLSPAELGALLEGIDLRKARRARLWNPPPGDRQPGSRVI
jgi:transposase